MGFFSKQKSLLLLFQNTVCCMYLVSFQPRAEIVELRSWENKNLTMFAIEVRDSFLKESNTGREVITLQLAVLAVQISNNSFFWCYPGIIRSPEVFWRRAWKCYSF